MPIRPAYEADRVSISALCSEAFFDEDLFGRVMHPRRQEFPDDPAIYWHGHILNLWCNWQNKVFVAVTQDKESGKEVVVGVGVWQRQGKGRKRLTLSSIDPRECQNI